MIARRIAVVPGISTIHLQAHLCALMTGVEGLPSRAGTMNVGCFLVSPPRHNLSTAVQLFGPSLLTCRDCQGVRPRNDTPDDILARSEIPRPAGKPSQRARIRERILEKRFLVYQKHLGNSFRVAVRLISFERWIFSCSSAHYGLDFLHGSGERWGRSGSWLFTYARPDVPSRNCHCEE